MNFQQAQGQHDCRQPPDPQPIKCDMRDCNNMIPNGDAIEINLDGTHPKTGKLIASRRYICGECYDSHCHECWSVIVKVPGNVCPECFQAAMEDSDE